MLTAALHPSYSFLLQGYLVDDPHNSLCKVPVPVPVPTAYACSSLWPETKRQLRSDGAAPATGWALKGRRVLLLLPDPVWSHVCGMPICLMQELQPQAPAIGFLTG